jgi:copper homeostasis protein
VATNGKLEIDSGDPYGEAMTALEICLDDVEGAAIAERNGADRVELCANLAQGGTTPSLGTVATVLSCVTRVGVQVLVRQRPGDFCYRPLEVAAMVNDIEAIGALARPAGVQVGFVVGALTRDQRVDVPVLTRLVRACDSAPVTFHKAFDSVLDQRTALEIIIDLGIGRVLTSGGQATAVAGLSQLAGLVDQANDRISVLAGGGIRAPNVERIVRSSGVREVHLRATPTADGTTTSAEVVQAVVAALARVTSEPPQPPVASGEQAGAAQTVEANS